jgi:hypothetical protein
MSDSDFPAFGVDFEKGEITRPDATPAPQQDKQPQGEPFDAFGDDPNAPEGEGRKPAGQEPGRRAVPDQIPKYRFDEVTEQLRQGSERERTLMALIERLSQNPPPAAPQAPGRPQTPQEQARERIRQQLFEVVPEFQEFLKFREKMPALLQAADTIPRLQEDTGRYWGHVADASLTAVQTALGTSLGAEVDPKSQLGRFASQAFFDYVARDPRLVARYEAQDPNLVGEFMQVFEREVLTPARAKQVQQARQEQTRRLPVAGRTSPPPSAQVPKRNDDEDEDGVFKRAWDHVLNARNAQSPS